MASIKIKNKVTGKWEKLPTMKGEKGKPGETGLGVPSGGLAGQVLVKKSDTDNDTEWVDNSGGGDGILTGSIFGFNGNTIPEGYEEVENNGGIETITNENGTAIKYPDGTLICRGFANAEANATNTTITFPFEFISNSYNVILTNRYLNGAYVVWSVASPTMTSLAVYPVDTSTKKAPTFSTRADYVAIGKWK